MIKVLFYLTGIYNGGTEIALHNLVSCIGKTKYDIYVTYTDKENSDIEIINKIKPYVNFINIEDRFSIDILIYCTDALNDKEILLENIKYKKSYFWFHYFWPSQEEFLKYTINNNLIDGVIAVSQTTKDKLLKLQDFTIEENKISVIHNILNSNSILEKSLEPVTMDLSDELNLITVARLAPVKGYERVKYLADALLAKNINFKWFILGKANNSEKEYDQKIKKLLEPYKNIYFLGEQQNPYKYMKNCDYTVILSERETWSLVITESKILGIPCITTDFDGVIEQITPMENGIIISRENVNTYYNKVDDIINDKEKLKENLKNFKYDISNILNKWDELLIL